MKWLKECFAPSLASFGATAYLKGDYKKAVSRIMKSIDWLPQMNDSEVFMGILGVSLSKLGNNHEALPYLTLAHDKLVNTTDVENSDFKIRLIYEIKYALHKNT